MPLGHALTSHPFATGTRIDAGQRALAVPCRSESAGASLGVVDNPFCNNGMVGCQKEEKKKKRKKQGEEVNRRCSPFTL